MSSIWRRMRDRNCKAYVSLWVLKCKSFNLHIYPLSWKLVSGYDKGILGIKNEESKLKKPLK